MNLPRAYAYIRFSSTQQKDGDSLRRQLESCVKYCDRNSLVLDAREFKDFGKSAYKKANLKKGSALHAFLALVDSREIPSGSYLLIESLDRLSRADIYSAITLFGSIISKGINIVDISNDRLYTNDTLTDLAPMLGILAHTVRAHDESKIKGVRSKANWNRRKENSKNFATPITRECPRWLEVSKDGKGYEILADKVASIRFVYELRKSGLGVTAIANRCNEMGLPAPAKGDIWHTSLVNRLIRNRALIGEYQPYISDEDNKRIPDGEPIPAFYPTVIELGLFEMVQQINQKAGTFPKRRGATNRNFLNGLIFCSCGASLHRKLKSSWDLDTSRFYCSKRVLHATKCKSIECRSIEDTVIYFMSENAPGLITFDNFADKLRMAEAENRSKLAEIDILMERALAIYMAGKSDEPPEIVRKTLKDLEEEKLLYTKKAERFLAESSDSAVYWGIKADKDFVTAIRIGDGDKLSHLRFQIARLVNKIVLSNDLKTLHVYLKNAAEAKIEIRRSYFDF